MENKHIKNRESGLVIMPNENPDTGFSKHEMFGNLSLSLDIIGRRLMISGIVNRIRRSFQIQLNATRRISIKKVYMNIYIGQLKKRSLEEFSKQSICSSNSLTEGKPSICPFLIAHSTILMTCRKLKKRRCIGRISFQSCYQ
jgi:hypothetical protein